MCGRYWIDPYEREDMLRIVEQMQRRDPQQRVQTSGEIFPGGAVPALCLSRAGNVRAFAMVWGYRLSNGRRVINARVETAADKPLFRDGLRSRRCLLPMSAYFEWEKRGSERVKYRITPGCGGLTFLAGIYRFEGDGPACTVLTTCAAPELAFIHDRMPVILRNDQCEAWLRRGDIEQNASPSLTFEAV